jgi:signal transduction histidine kinase
MKTSFLKNISDLLESSRSTIYLLLAVLSVLILTVSVLDYQRVYSITYALAEEKALVLITQVERAAERASVSEESVRIAVTDQLFAVANLVRRWVIEYGYEDIDLGTISMDGGVSRIDIFDDQLVWIKGSQAISEINYRLPESEILGDLEGWIIGLFTINNSNDRYYGVAVTLPNGGIVRVAIPAEELRAIRMDVGLSGLLLDLTKHPEVLYAVLDTKETLIASTPNLPDWVVKPGDPFHDESLLIEDFEAEFINSPDGPIFEARTPFSGGVGVILRLGIFSKSLEEIRTRSRFAIGIRMILFLIFTMIIIAFLISRQNIRLLEKEREKIKKEIRSLESERTLRERLAGMGALAGGVAHEIRNPLNTIGMAAQRLEFELTPESDQELYKNIVRSMRQETQRIERIVSDFLIFARPPVINKQKHNLSNILDQITGTFSPLAEAKNVNFLIKEGSIAAIQLDADQIRQAVLNLLKNALDAVQPEIGIITLRSSERDKWLIVEVSDNGLGVAEDVKRKIFDLYFTTKASGTGVGLAMVHRIAVEHGGRVELDDTPGGGATFTMYLERKLQ